jgi:hypothetical protein
MKKCDLCGATISDDLDRCPECGSKVEPLPMAKPANNRGDIYAILAASLTATQVLAPAGLVFAIAAIGKTKRHQALAIVSIVFSAFLTLLWIVATVYYVIGITSVRYY